MQFDRPYYYILTSDGEPSPCESMMVWATWMQSATADEERRIALDELADNVTVSTVFLGLDHQYGNGPPLLFETMVFGGSFNYEMRRYSTRAEALAGHARVVRDLRGALASKEN